MQTSYILKGQVKMSPSWYHSLVSYETTINKRFHNAILDFTGSFEKHKLKVVLESRKILILAEITLSIYIDFRTAHKHVLILSYIIRVI